MTGTINRRKPKLLAYLLAVLCLLSFVLRDIPVAFAAEPENISLEFVVGDTHTTVSEDGTHAEYDIPVTDRSQIVRMLFRMSLNKHYREGQLRIEIPYNGFFSRDGESSYHMSNKSAVLSQISGSASKLKLLEDRSRSGGPLIFTNKDCNSLQMDLAIEYEVYSMSVEDGAEHTFHVTVTDTDEEEPRSPADLTAVFDTKVTQEEVTKRTDIYGVQDGCYYMWDDSLEQKFALTSKYNIGKEEFDVLKETYHYVSYIVSYTTTANQQYDVYIRDEPGHNGEVVAVSKLFTARECYPMDKETEGPHAGDWKVTGSDYGRVYILARYKISELADVSAINNKVTVFAEGVDGHSEDKQKGTASCASTWQDAGNVKPGDIWSIEKESFSDPYGGMNLLREGHDVTLGYRIAGIGKTYKYGVNDDFTYTTEPKKAPYVLELCDDALYATGLGEDASDMKRLTKDDFWFKTFTVSLMHDMVDEVYPDLSIKNRHTHPIDERDPVKVYVMTADRPDEWQFDQDVTIGAENSSYNYVDENGSSEFKFKHNKVYRIKFVYNNANGDVKLTSNITGILKHDGPVVKEVLENIKDRYNTFQIFNWDAQMGYYTDPEGNKVWDNPDNGSNMRGNPQMINDLLELDEELYDGHTASVDDVDNREISRRLPASNTLREIYSFAGAGKKLYSQWESDGKAYFTWEIQAVRGGSSSIENLQQLIDSGAIRDSREVVFHELLPIGVKIMNADHVGYSYYNDNSYFNWEHVTGNYPGHLEVTDRENEPEINILTEDNYRGTHRQMATIKVTYPNTPIVKIGEYEYDLMYGIGSMLNVKCVGEYTDMYSTQLDNHMSAQFLDEDGLPIELDGTAVYPDDGTVFSEVDDADGNDAFYDADGDGVTDRDTVVGKSSTSNFDVVVTTTQLKKWIKSDDYDTYFKDFTQIYAGHDYTYKIQFFINNGYARNVVLFDSIEEAYKDSEYLGMPHWKGTLRGVDISELTANGFRDVKVYVNKTKYYSNEEMMTDNASGFEGLTPADLTAANGWEVVSDIDNYDGWADVRTIAFSMGKEQYFGMDDTMPKSATVYLKMTAPDTIPPEQKPTSENGEKAQVLAYNQPAYYAEKDSSTSTSAQWPHDTTIAQAVTVGVKSAETDLPAITKKISGDIIPESFRDNVEFEIIPDAGTPAPRSYSNGSWGDEISSVSVALSGSTTTAVADSYGRALYTEPTKVSAEDGTLVGPQRDNYAYTIKEKQGSTPGVTYSGAQYRVEYEVSDVRLDVQYADPTTLTVTQTIYRTHDDDGNELAQPEKVDSIVFSNKFTTVPVRVTVPAVVKKITGDERPEEKTFAFTIRPLAGQTSEIPMPENDTVTVTGEGTAPSFGEISFSRAGQYIYEIFEQPLDEGCYGYTRDASIYLFTVTVTENGGELTAAASLTKEGAEVTQAEFTNKYKADGTEIAVPTAVKAIDGSVPEGNARVFSFGIRAAEGQGDIPMPAVTSVNVSGAGPAAQFGTIEYSAAGTYVYEIYECELDPSYTGYTRDETVYIFTVTVVDNDGRLQASGVLTKNGEAADEPRFTNVYRPVSAEAVIGVEKAVTGAAPASPESYTFVLADGTTVSEIERVTVTGAGTAQFAPFTYSEAGVYRYTVSEAAGTNALCTYDTSVFNVKDTVTDVDGQLTVSREITLNGAAVQSVKFTNSYEEDSSSQSEDSSSQSEDSSSQADSSSQSDSSSNTDTGSTQDSSSNGLGGDSAADSGSTASSQADSSSSASSATSSATSSTATSTSSGTTTTTASTTASTGGGDTGNPRTGSAVLAGINVMLIGAAFCVARKRKEK